MRGFPPNAAPTPPSTWRPHQTLPDTHTLLHPLGQGATAEVWAAIGPRGPVALKALWPALARSPPAVAALIREARKGQEYRHPALVRTLGTGHDGLRPYIVMELLQGAPLPEAGLIPVPRRALARLLRRPAQALARLHAAGVIHGDVKPANLFLEPGRRLRLLDLGTLRAIPGTTLDFTAYTPPHGLPAATPRWAAPERLRGEPPDPRDDIYSLALVAAWLLGTPQGHHAPAGLRDALGPRHTRPTCPIRMVRGLDPWSRLWPA